ncbi:MAG: hypothetical protein VB858_10300 [Planctomycetaceae bacterium]
MAAEPVEVNPLRIDEIEVKPYVDGLVKEFERKVDQRPVSRR